MATYKVLQDIEAEDKLVGPFTLRQFIYAAIVIVIGFINFKLLAVSPFLTLPLLPPMIFFALLAAPFGHDQSSEVWLLAKIRFALKPRVRLWNQDGIQELVTITVPKKVERNLTNNLSQSEVKSRLHALANTLDSRGWAVKNVDVNSYSHPSYLTDNQADSDRLIDIGSLPQEVPSFDVQPTDDIMDEFSNPVAQHLDTMIHQSEQSHRQAVLSQVQSTATATPTTNQGQPADYWFMNQPSSPVVPAPGYATFEASQVVRPGMPADDLPSQAKKSTASEAEQALLKKLRDEKGQPNSAYTHLKTLQPLSDDPQAAGQAPQAPDQNSNSNASDAASAGSASVNPDILRLASNDDLNVATIAREANRTKQHPDDEVVISLR